MAMDTTSEPSATATYLVGYAGSLPAGQIFGFGELLVDTGSQRFFQRTRPVSGGQSIHTSSIPNDPSLQGVVAYTQVFILGDDVQATNAVKLRLR